MATENKPDKLEVLFGKVYLPVFMQKLASRGVEVKTEEDLQGTLKIAAMARIQQGAEQPVEQPSVIKEAAARLEAMTFNKEANLAAEFVKDPEVAAVLV